MGVLFVAPGEITIDASASGQVIAVVGVVETKAFQQSEMGLNGIEPTGIGGCPDQTHVVFPSKVFQ